VAKLLEKHGITGVEFSGGNLDNGNYPNLGPIRARILKKSKQSYFAAKTARIAENLNIPVISVGGHRDLEVIGSILATTPIEYFSMSRLLHSEPGMVNRW
jgi:2,4-dienoyl-CoA reductase-like NADH-dependent reductase (Old Yellow Enzyme family)